MAEVRPFQGLHYDPKVVGSLSDVLCPPFDVISASLQEELHRLNPHNAVRLELGMSASGDNGGSNAYTRAADLFAAWQRDGALIRERSPGYYVLRHRFQDRTGQRLERWGITASVRLEEFDRGVVLPHEETMGAPKEDRLALMEACHANFSPVMAFYRQGAVADAVRSVAQAPPALEATYGDGDDLALWVADDPAFTQVMQDGLRDAPLFIADGHHRYETALLYRDRRRKRTGSWSGDEAYNYVMMTLIDFDDPGLVVLPYHRMVGGLAPTVFTALRNRLLEVFRVDSFPRQPSTPEALEEAVAQCNQDAPALGLLGPEGEGPYLLTSLGAGAHEGQGPAALDEALRDFEGWVLQEKVLNPVLGEEVEAHTSYTHDPREAWERVLTGEQQMALFMRPFPLDLFEAVVSAGVRLPPKSTYFHPKLPTGLVFHLLDE